MYTAIPASIEQLMQDIETKCGETNLVWAKIFRACFANTLLTTIKKQPDGSTYVLTGDIPAMWLRDSVAQVRPYLVVAKQDQDLSDMIAGLVERQFQFIQLDPYANAFNETANNAGHQDDTTQMHPHIWERKYEIDSLCYPIQLAYLLYKNTGRTDQFNQTFQAGVDKILHVWETEQHHDDQSPYQFVREETLNTSWIYDNIRCGKSGYTGMTWSGFRPSDDSCTYGYLVPSNMFAVVVLDYLQDIFSTLIPDPVRHARAAKLREAIQNGIEQFAKITNAAGDTLYAYEVNGLGDHLIMDDANVPSLLSAPYLGYVDKHDPIYQATRQTILSSENPYYYEGTHAKGIGSPHTPERYVWPIALAMQGLTTDDKAEKERILNHLVACDAGTNLMHEGFHVDDPHQYTREWFSWANMMFCELVLDYYDIRVCH